MIVGNPMMFSGASAGDPYYANVSLLCNFETSANDAKGKVATTTGAPTFSAGQMHLNGSVQYATFVDHEDFNFGSSDFTIEFLATLGTGVKGADFYYTLLHQHTGTSTTASALYLYFESRSVANNRAWSCKWFSDAGSVLVSLEEPANAVNDYTEGVEYHTSIMRRGSAFSLCRNGVEKASATYAGALADPTGLFQVGADLPGAGYFKGSVNALRITKGVARYTANFTPPVAFPEF